MLAGFLCHRYANLAMCPAPARPEQTQSPLSDTDTAKRREREALKQQRAELVRALDAAERSIEAFLPGSLQEQKARRRVARLQNELRLMRGKLGLAEKRQDLGELLIVICRERSTTSEWQHIVAEARRRPE
ncbi:hypothetical protein [Paraburkholderia heleia]|uniref:hypothetical protein n=1 Tax=Paraburkholderia heleia TaxID=634127 RepID=UPI001FE137AA|nr:hypothetical protein [Paraburkholderia heleia]